MYHLAVLVERPRQMFLLIQFLLDLKRFRLEDCRERFLHQRQ
jgi:hypothetical protein